MKEKLVNLKTAKLAKEKKFTWVVYNCFEDKKSFKEPEGCKNDYTEFFHDVYVRPTLTILQKWLRDVHKISVLPEHGRMEDNSFGYFCRIYTKLPSSGQTKIFEYRNSYEEALEIGLQEALKLI